MAERDRMDFTTKWQSGHTGKLVTEQQLDHHQRHELPECRQSLRQFVLSVATSLNG
jgi:hypothetical protein